MRYYTASVAEGPGRLAHEGPQTIALLKFVGWAFFILVVIGILIISPVGRLVSEWEEFQEWKRKRGKPD